MRFMYLSPMVRAKLLDFLEYFPIAPHFNYCVVKSGADLLSLYQIRDLVDFSYSLQSVSQSPELRISVASRSNNKSSNGREYI